MTVLDDEHTTLDRLIERSVALGAREPVSAQLQRRRDHRGSVNLDVILEGSEWRREVFVKRLTPHAFDRYRRAAEGGYVHGVTMMSDPGHRLADEAVTLTAIGEMVARSGHGNWFAVEVDHELSDRDTLVLGRVAHHTLTEHLGRPDTKHVVATAARSLGSWINAFHSLEPFDHSVAHLGSRDEVVSLADRLVGSIVELQNSTLHERVTDVMLSVPEQSPVCPSHGVLRGDNVFVDDAGRVAVFDTSADALSPPHLDLARLAIDLELAANIPSVRRPSVRLGESTGVFAAVLEGYGPTAPSRVDLRPFEVLVLLDRWVSIANRRSRSLTPAQLAKRMGRRVHAHRVRQLLNARLIPESV